MKDDHIGISEHLSWPIREVNVSQFYSPELEEGADEKAIVKYMRQIAKGKYEPISISWRFSDDEPLDGSHRIIAAKRLGLSSIKAYVDPSKRRGKR